MLEILAEAEKRTGLPCDTDLEAHIATLNHFGFNTEFLLNKAGMTPERVQELLQQGMAWALPNMMLGSLVIIPAWLLIILFRPPRSSE